MPAAMQMHQVVWRCVLALLFASSVYVSFFEASLETKVRSEIVSWTNSTSDHNSIFADDASKSVDFFELATYLIRHGCSLLGFTIVFFGASGLCAMLFSLRRERMPETLGRFAFFAPLFAIVYCAAAGRNCSSTFGDTEWTYASLGALKSGAFWFTTVFVCFQISSKIVAMIDAEEVSFVRGDNNGSIAVLSLRSRIEGYRFFGLIMRYTTVAIVISATALSVGLFMPILHVFSRVSHVMIGDDDAISTTLKSPKQNTRISAFSLPSLILDRHTLNASERFSAIVGVFLVYGCVVLLPLCRIAVSLILWLVPMKTTAYRKALVFMELASNLVCHDVFAVVILASSLELETYLTKSLNNIVSDEESHSYRVRLNATSFVALVFGCILEQTISSWITFRLTTELVDLDSDIQTFPDWLLKGSNSARNTQFDIVLDHARGDPGARRILLSSSSYVDDEETKFVVDQDSYQNRL